MFLSEQCYGRGALFVLKLFVAVSDKFWPEQCTPIVASLVNDVVLFYIVHPTKAWNFLKNVKGVRRSVVHYIVFNIMRVCNVVQRVFL